MATVSDEQRALQLAEKAGESTRAGDLASAARFLREASTIAPENPQIQDAWTRLKKEEDKSELLALCKIWVKTKAEDDGDRVLRAVQKQGLKQKEAEQAMDILFDYKGEGDTLDQVTGELLQNVGAQTWLANAVREQPTRIYYEMFERGDDSINGLLKVLLNRAVWPDDDSFKNGHRDMFMLSLAMMMEEALEHPERAMKGIAQLLAHHAEDLKGIIDSDSFDVILASLDIRLPNSLRAQATLASIKLFELVPDTASELISKFVTQRAKKGEANDLVIAFSAAAAIFPVAVTPAATLFLTEGFVNTLVPLVEKKKSQKLEQAALELISAACVDKNCRDAINKHCREWLEELVADSPDKKRANLAALVLVKLGEEAPSDGGGPRIMRPARVDQSDLIASFKSMVIIGGDNASKQDSIEGLAYASLQPKVREDLSKSPKFIKRLVGTMSEPGTPSNILFGGLTILVNITAYLPIQSEEEKRMAQLKAYANVQKPSDDADELLNDAAVHARCKRIMDSGIVPLLVQVCKKGSPTMLSHSSQILLSLSRDSKSRGTMAQQGAIKLLIQIWETMSSSTTTTTTPYAPTAARASAQALSRLLISINPSHIFNAALPSTSALRPLVSQLAPTDSSSWQLDAFEALLALTNLASLDTATQDHMLRLCFDALIDDMLLGNHTMLRRAATELLCNLMASPTCVARFADPDDPRAKQRLHLLLAMTDVEDLATRSAAGGALAMLLGMHDMAVDALLRQDKGVDLLLGLCRDEDEHVKYRGVVCVRSVAESDKGVERLKAKGAVDCLKGVLRESRREDVLGTGVESLKILLGQ
ncbi:SWI5-dependent HO expression protein 4 [Pleosporales sp. CAS-2024a]